MLYKGVIEDELMIQFIILYAIEKADEEIQYTDLLNVVQQNCEISFTDMMLGIDNLESSGHISVRSVMDMPDLYDVTEKGRYVIDFFYKQIPLIIRDQIDKSIKELFIEKRRREAVKIFMEPLNEKEFYAACTLKNDDRTVMMQLKLYAGDRDEAERVTDYFKNNCAELYSGILNIIDCGVKGADEQKDESKTE